MKAPTALPVVAALLAVLAFTRSLQAQPLANIETVTENRPSPAPLRLTFNAQEYVFHSAAGGNHIFIPASPAYSSGGIQDAVQIQTYNRVDEDKLEPLLSDIRERYEQIGRILRTSSKPPTDGKHSEHLIVAILGEPGVVEATFARIAPVDNLTVMAIYSRRAPADEAEKDIGAWLESHGALVEEALVSWDLKPVIAGLRAASEPDPGNSPE